MRKSRPRSDYRHALALARKARRRGDVIAAERWLKQSHRLQGMDTHFAAFVQARKEEAAERREQRDSHRQAQEAMRAHLNNVLDQIERSVDDEPDTFDGTDEVEGDEIFIDDQ